MRILLQKPTLLDCQQNKQTLVADYQDSLLMTRNLSLVLLLMELLHVIVMVQGL